MLPVNAFAASAVPSRMFYMAFDLRNNVQGLDGLFHHFPVDSNEFTSSVVKRGVVLVVIASITEDTHKRSWPEMKEPYSSLMPLKSSRPSLSLAAAHANVDGGVANDSFFRGIPQHRGGLYP